GPDDPAPSTALQKEAPSIRPIGASSVHRICSGQVVLDLAGAVKELVENALDAGATNIEVRLRDHGQDSVEVVDNGCGVKSDDLAMMTKKYATSKIRRFEDLDALASFGFRGEALSSLCALSDLSVTTRTADSDAGTRVEYDAEGNVRTRGVVARAVGTTVTVQNVFARLPVRRKELARNVKREYGKLLNILQAYALINPETRIVCSHQGKGKNAPRQTVLNTQGGGSLRAAVATVFGHKTIDGMVSKAAPGCGRGAGDRQFFFVNGRPVDLPKAARVCNETYRQYNQTTSGTPFPCVVLDFRLPTDAYDVNVTPDKRKVLLHGESKVLAGLRGALEKIWSPTAYTYAVAAAGAADGSETTRVRVHDAIGAARDVIAGGPSAATPALPPASAVGVKREREEDDDATVVAPSVDVKREPAEDRVPRGTSAAASAWESFGMNAPRHNTANDATTTANDRVGTGKVGRTRRTFPCTVRQSTRPRRSASSRGPRARLSRTRTTSHRAATHREARVKRRREGTRGASVNDRATAEGGLGPALNEGGDEVATGELERVFRREDFRDMRVVGQFNLGFILCTLGDDLFIVDQHASDEIYNFERLQRTTTLNRQPLLVPKKLELTAAETQTVHRNMPTFLANGFGFCEVDQPPPTVRSLALNSVPFSKGITFGADDVHELIGMLDQGEYALPARSQLTVGLSRQSTGTPGSGLSVSEIVRPSRVRAMLAMRACRSSIMIGKALDAKTMRRVLDNLSDLQAPWNCPHGRPTMRHLADLRKL
ncbi:DNA mismatch repair protein-MLH2/PMS1/Pms2 family, partial [Micromonas commoda]